MRSTDAPEPEANRTKPLDMGFQMPKMMGTVVHD